MRKQSAGQKCWGIKRKGSHGLEIREGFMEEAGAVLNMKDSWALDGQRGRKGINCRKRRSCDVAAATAEWLVEGAERSQAASSSSSSHLLTAPGRRGWGQNIQRQGPALKKVPF